MSDVIRDPELRTRQRVNSNAGMGTVQYTRCLVTKSKEAITDYKVTSKGLMAPTDQRQETTARDCKCGETHGSQLSTKRGIKH